MRWQKIARLAIASFVIVFAGVVFFIMRQRTAAPRDVPPEAAPVPVDARLVNQGPLEYELTQDGKLRYRIVGKQHRLYADGKNTVEHVELTLPDRRGKTIVIKADEAELTQPAGKELGVAVFR
jgi:lipopolysaccharide export system protein LptC